MAAVPSKLGDEFGRCRRLARENIDATHERMDTIREFETWRPVLRDGALVAFDDYAHPEFPGAREAVQQLRLDVEEQDGLFMHCITSTAGTDPG
jgi:hypothetical protein